MSAWRFTTDCLTGLRHWHRYVRAGRPERPVLWPCARAALILPPLLGLPSSVFYGPGGGWWASSPGYEFAGGAFPGLVPSVPGGGPPAVPGNLFARLPPLPPASPPLVVFLPPITPEEQPTRIPEPATIGLVALGAAAAALVKRRTS